MKKHQILENIDNFSHRLIIDNNSTWNHKLNYTLINNYIHGDLHDFFDCVQDERLFQVIDDQFDLIFIGEVFHVLDLQTIVYNLEYAVNCLNAGGLVMICINDNSFATNGTPNTKIIDRLEKLKEYQVKHKLTYTDEQGINWTLLGLQVKSDSQPQVINIDDALIIATELATMVKSGKNPEKIKKGYLQSKSSIDSRDFKAAYTSNIELLELYIQSQIIELKPNLNYEYIQELANLIFSNRKLIIFCNRNQLLEGSFNLALDMYLKTAIKPDNEMIANYASLIEKVWNHCTKQRLSDQLSLEIRSIKELNASK